MQSIRNHIIYITYQDKMTQRENKLLIQNLLEIKDEIKRRGLQGIFISFKDIKYNIDDLKEFIKQLQFLESKLNISISIGDYDASLFKILKNLTNSTYIKLFQNEEIAKLYLTPQYFKNKLQILLLNDNDDNDIDKQSSFLSKFGHSIMYAQNINEFNKVRDKNKTYFAISQSRFNLFPRKNSNSNKSIEEKRSFKLSRLAISNLPSFVDTAVDTLVTITALEAKKISHNIKTFNNDILDDIVGTIMEFKGDMDGSFTLIMPENLAKMAIESMLGEALEGDNPDDIIDGVGEFCNIITGSVKTNLSKKDINVTFALPKTYTSIKQIKQFLPQNNGIWINMELSNKPFYMFIVK